MLNLIKAPILTKREEFIVRALELQLYMCQLYEKARAMEKDILPQKEV